MGAYDPRKPNKTLQEIIEGQKKYTCKDGTVIWTVPGKKSKNDFIVKTRFPNIIVVHSLELAGMYARLKAQVEEINYPRNSGLLGWQYIFDYYRWMIFRPDISEDFIFKKFKLPGF